MTATELILGLSYRVNSLNSPSFDLNSRATPPSAKFVEFGEG